MNKHLCNRRSILFGLSVFALLMLACDVAGMVPQSKSSPAEQTAVPATSAVTFSVGATPSPTPRPPANVAQVGQRIVSQGIAVTMTNAQSMDTLEETKAAAGSVWVVTTVTVENVSNARVTVEEEQFDYVDKSGSVVLGLVNAPSAPGALGKDVFGFHELVPGGKAENKLLPIQVKKELLSGLQLLFTIDKANSIKWSLGF